MFGIGEKVGYLTVEIHWAEALLGSSFVGI